MFGRTEFRCNWADPEEVRRWYILPYDGGRGIVQCHRTCAGSMDQSVTRGLLDTIAGGDKGWRMFSSTAARISLLTGLVGVGPGGAS
jgi:hypothetical protein